MAIYDSYATVALRIAAGVEAGERGEGRQRKRAGPPRRRGDPDVPRSAINPFTSAGASEPRRHTAPSPAREPVLDLGEPRIAGTVVDRSLPSCAEAEQHPRPAAVIRSRR